MEEFLNALDCAQEGCFGGDVDDFWVGGAGVGGGDGWAGKWALGNVGIWGQGLLVAPVTVEVRSGYGIPLGSLGSFLRGA